MPSGLELAHFVPTTAAKKSTAPPCSDKQSVLILVPQYAIEESQMSPNYVPSPKGLCPGLPWPERWRACHKSSDLKAQGKETHCPRGSDRHGEASLFWGGESCPPIQHLCLTGNLNSCSIHSLPASLQERKLNYARKGVLFLCN